MIPQGTPLEQVNRELPNVEFLNVALFASQSCEQVNSHTTHEVQNFGR